MNPLARTLLAVCAAGTAMLIAAYLTFAHGFGQDDEAYRTCSLECATRPAHDRWGSLAGRKIDRCRYDYLVALFKLAPTVGQAKQELWIVCPHAAAEYFQGR